MIRYRLVFIFSLFCCFYSLKSFSQRDNTYTVDASAVLGTAQTPFWMRANKFGKVPTKGQTMAVFAGVKSDYQNPENKIDWGYSLNIGGFAGMQNKFIIQQAYAKAKWRAFELFAGRREEIQGLVDTTLTSGSYIWSGNALPMPKIDLGIRDYTSIGGEGLISIKGNYAHGWFDRKRDDAIGVKLHQKSFYFRIGKPNYKFKFYSGFNHQAQWGGVSQYDDAYAKLKKGDKFGATLRDYYFIFTGRSTIGTDTSIIVGENEKANRIGNHLGTLDFGLEIDIPKAKLFIYRQSIFEDGSLFYLNNIQDGLHGLSFTFKNSVNRHIKLNKIIFEYLNTLNQGGPFYDNNPLAMSLRGSDNYFNNSQFRDGWSYQKTSIGSPFMLTNDEFKNPDFNGAGYFTNIKVQSYYIGLQGSLYDIVYQGRLSISNNWGNFNRHLNNPYKQTSFLISAAKNFEKIFNLNNVDLNFSLAGDFGELLSQNIAVNFGIRKSLHFLPFRHPIHLH